MKKISYWAKKNPRKSQAIITACHFSLIALASILASLFKERGVLLNNNIFYWCLILFLLLAAFYPGRKQYAMRKTADFIFVILGFIQFCVLFNTDFLQKKSFTGLYAASIGTDSSLTRYRVGDFKYGSSEKILAEYQQHHKKLNRRDQKILVKELKYQSRKMAAQGPGNGDNTAEIIGIIALALLVSTGILLLSCAIACGGAEVLAGIVLVAGLVAVVWLAVIRIKQVNRRAITKNKSIQQTT
jgi:hypothetical protein